MILFVRVGGIYSEELARYVVGIRSLPAEQKERLMGLFDWFFGRKEELRPQPAAPTFGGLGDGGQQPPDADEQALQRYRYMLKTAPPELAAATPEEERAALAGGRDDPKSLARLATRAEMRQPGTMERTFGGTGRGPGMGGMMGGMGSTIFTSLAASFVGSVVAQQFLSSVDDFGFGESDTSDQSGDEETYDNAGD